MKLENMLVLLHPSPLAAIQCQPAMDTTRDRMNGGRMSTVPPTHIPLPPVDQRLYPEESSEEKDNAFNSNIRYRNQNTHATKPHARKASSNRAHPGSGPVKDKRLSMGASVPMRVCSDSTTGQMVLCRSSDMISWSALQGSFRVLLPETMVPRPKSSCSSSSSCSSTEDAVDPVSRIQTLELVPEGSVASGDALTPPLPPRGANCYENIPVPGIIPLSKSPAQIATSPQPPETSQSKESISLYSRMSGFDTGAGKVRIARALSRLEQSGFFFESISAAEAKVKLRPAQVGTFLVRVSSQLSHLFALSVKTNRGTTSIRLTYENGNFSLDADPQSVSKMPAFECIIALIEYYVVQSASDARNKCVFLESNGRRDTPVILTRPLRDQPQSLKHLCRRSLHYHHSLDTLGKTLSNATPPCSVQTKEYIMDYPYAL